MYIPFRRRTRRPWVHEARMGMKYLLDLLIRLQRLGEHRELWVMGGGPAENNFIVI